MADTYFSKNLNSQVIVNLFFKFSVIIFIPKPIINFDLNIEMNMQNSYAKNKKYLKSFLFNCAALRIKFTIKLINQ